MRLAQTLVVTADVKITDMDDVKIPGPAGRQSHMMTLEDWTVRLADDGVCQRQQRKGNEREKANQDEHVFEEYPK